MMDGLLVLGVGLAAGYALLTGWYLHCWREEPEREPPKEAAPRTRLSVIVPMRNEAANLPACLEALSRQRYPLPLWELILVDDHSEDESAEIARGYPLPNLRLLRLEEAAPRSFGKKAALEAGIRAARGELIVTTDADCRMGPEWLQALAAAYEAKGWCFLAAPVHLHEGEGVLSRFQALDMLGMMAATLAGIRSGLYHMANGANLAYPRRVFQAVGGFEGIEGRASGDDVLLMQKIARRYPGRLTFLKSRAAEVWTSPQPTLKRFFWQRFRWASKSDAYREPFLLLVLGGVLLFCLLLLSVPFWAFAGWKYLAGGLCLLAVKSFSDYWMLNAVARWANRSHLLRNYWPMQLLHIAYIAGVGVLANLWKQYPWKGRKVR